MQSRPADPKLMQAYANAYKWMAPFVDSPQKLMSFIDAETRRQVDQARTPGSQTDMIWVDRAKSALKELYGINDYTPKGFLDWSDEQQNWVNPRMSSGGDSEKSPPPFGGALHPWQKPPSGR